MVRPEHEDEDGAAEQRAQRGAADAGDDVAVVVGLVREGPADETWRGELSSNFSSK